ncbi:hypothetical protein A1OE_1433 [Candidatus Endolissoclinum faulkneri L2]|uniref:Uncharacterized protein n=1 Tax=Candidatus Endolissoclinum faulkneri L2 TaxID=1193729 RepID=K7YPX9_9PROT|nr:hypothetical protein A1OE_1433 [Candidatus Endolissoclinum faulkneri L2]
MSVRCIRNAEKINYCLLFLVNYKIILYKQIKLNNNLLSSKGE